MWIMASQNQTNKSCNISGKPLENHVSNYALHWAFYFSPWMPFDGPSVLP